MFQLPIRRVMQFVVMIVALVSIPDVCQAGSITMNDTKHNFSTQNTKWRLKITTYDNAYQQHTYTMSGTPTTPPYTYVGSTFNGYYTDYQWKCTNTYIFGGENVGSAWVESSVDGGVTWTDAGAAIGAISN